MMTTLRVGASITMTFNHYQPWTREDSQLVHTILANLPRNRDGTLERNHITDHVVLNLARHLGRSEAAIRARVEPTQPVVTHVHHHYHHHY